MNKALLIPVLAAFGTMLLLYLVGYIAQIDSLKLKISMESSEIALLPIFIGLIVCYVSERIMKLRLKSESQRNK